MQRDSARSETRVVTLYMAFTFLSNFSTILYFLTLYLSGEGVGVATISLLLLVYQVTKFVAEVPSGFLSDRLGHKAVGLVGLAGLGLYFLSLLITTNPAALVLAFVARGLGYAALSGTFEVIYVNLVDHDRLVRYKTVENAVFYVSYGASALLGGFLASAGLYRLGIACDLAAIVLALLVCIPFPSDRALLKEQPGKGDPDGEGTDESEPVTPGAILTWLKGDGVVLALVSMSLTLAFSFVAIEDFYALLLDESGLGAQWSGVAIAVELVLSAVAGLAVPRVLERVRQRRLLVFSKLSQFLLTLAFLLPVVPTPLRPVLYVAGSAISSMGAPLTYSLFHQRVPAGFRGTLISVQSQAVAIGAIAGYGASALVVDALGLNVTLLALFSVTFVAQLAALGYVCRHAPEDQLP